MLKDVASVAKPETILGWYRRLVAKKFDGSKKRRSPGRPRIDTEIEKLILEIVDKNSDRGYDKGRRRAGESRLRCLRSDRGQCAQAAWDLSSAQAERRHRMEGVH